jgi:protein-export membrane protein SecD
MTPSMNPKSKLWLAFVGVLVLTVAAGWLVYPQGSKINLKPLKINYEKHFKINLGLDLQGGSHLVYKANFGDVAASDRADALSAIRDIIERRVNSFGVSEPQVAVAGDDRIIIELPGIKDVNEAIRQIGETPQLQFKTQGEIPSDLKPDANGEIAIDANEIWDNTALSGKQLKKATVEFQQQGLAEPVVKLEFNDEGKQLFAEITKNNLQKPVAIFLDGQVISAPTVQAVINDGIAIISGGFSVQQAKELATRLNSGALPVPIELISQENVGATLGKDSIQKSFVAGLLGLVLIAIFMITFYRLPGVLATVALVIYTLLSLAIFKVGISFTAVVLVGLFFFLALTVNAWFGLLAFLSYIILMLLGALQPVTLTLAGIAGFILSIGMAVDANILIFERMKEEIRSGKDLDKAIDDGFARAWLSIRDSNSSSLITTLILYIFGSPSIKGFAITLSIGIVISMFTAITISRTLLKLFIGQKLAKFSWLYGAKTINPATAK